MRWQPMDYLTATGTRAVTGLYQATGGWYNPRQGVSLQPNYAAAAAGANSYDVIGDNGHHGGWQSFVPIWGLARDAYHDFQDGNFWTGVLESVGTVADAALLGAPSLVEGTLGRISVEGALAFGREGTAVGFRGLAVGGIAAGSEIVASGAGTLSVGGRWIGIAGRVGFAGSAAEADLGAIAIQAAGATSSIVPYGVGAGIAASDSFISAAMISGLLPGLPTDANISLTISVTTTGPRRRLFGDSMPEGW